MKKIFAASTIISLLLSFFICLPAQLYSYDFGHYRSDDSFNLPSFRFQDFQKELNQQKGIFSSTFNAYQNFNDNNISRNLFGFDVTNPVSVVANFEVQKELVSLPEAGVSIDIANISSKQFYLPEASKKPGVIETQSATGAELFTQQFGGSDIKTDNVVDISSEKDIIPNWFKPGKSIFEPTQSEQVGGQDVERIKDKDNEQVEALKYNNSARINYSLEGKDGKFIDMAPQLQKGADFISREIGQDFKEDLAQVTPITPLKLTQSDPGIIPGESWEKVKDDITNKVVSVAVQAIKDKIELKNQIKQSYNVAVKDGNIEWGINEIKSLEAVLSNLPEHFYNGAALEFVKRSDVYIKDGTERADVFGCYDSNEKTVNIFNLANSPVDFDMAGQQFVGTIVHELTHVFQSYDKTNNTTYENPYENPLVKDYAKVTNWVKDKDSGQYVFQGNRATLPTSYAGFDILEDMAESAMFYYCDPDVLKSKSPQRYEFLREYLFEGKEFTRF